MKASKGLTTQRKNLMKTLVILICSLSLALLHLSSAQEPQGPQGAKGKKKAASTQQGAPQSAKVKLRMLIGPQNMLLNQGKLVSRQESPLRRSTSTLRNSQTWQRRHL